MKTTLLKLLGRGLFWAGLASTGYEVGDVTYQVLQERNHPQSPSQPRDKGRDRLLLYGGFSALVAGDYLVRKARQREIIEYLTEAFYDISGMQRPKPESDSKSNK